MDKKEMKGMSLEQLTERIEEARRELFSLRLNAVTAHVKDYSQFRKKRRTIARLLTFLAKQENQVEG